jgi:hypothetical protein
MNKTITPQRQLIIFGVPILFIISIVLITKLPVFSLSAKNLSAAITIDLLFTIPLVYLLLIRKTNIPKTTTIPLLILCIIIGTIILPKENQKLLSLFIYWIMPIIELTVLGYVFYNIRKAILKFKNNKKSNFDFFTILKATCYEILPKKVVMFVVTEIAVFYYGFIYWRKKIPKPNEFTYHKKSGTISLLVAIIFIVGIESYVLHVLLAKWNFIVAIVLLFLSIYSGIQIFGFLKSLLKRPYVIEKNQLKLHYGILSETFIDLTEIESIELSNKDIEFDNHNRKLSPLGSLEPHNIIIKLKGTNILNGLYGITKEYKTLAFYVDDKMSFKNAIKNAIIKNELQ